MPDEPTKPGLIYEKIPEIIGAIGPVEKGRKNAQQGYNFRGVDEIYTALNKMLAKNKVTIVPVVVSQTESEVVSSRGAKGYRVCLKVEYHLYAQDGSSITSCVSGEAIDYGDKATPKALSMAYKYMAFQVFCIPTEESLDTENESHDLAADTNAPWEDVVCHVGSRAKGKRLGAMPKEMLEGLIKQWAPEKGPNGQVFPRDANLRFALDEAAVKLNINQE